MIAGLLIIALTVLRTSREEGALKEELEGYEDYARDVPYRLLPGVW
jgi:protein-S-isoprenylcysteine O-methyltransferase Ste14